MQKLKLPDHRYSKKSLNLIADTLKRGGLVVYPTDTSYLIGVDATNKTAVDKLFELKQRKKSKPIHVIVADLEMAKKYTVFSNYAEKIAKSMLPGPITLILKRKAKVLAPNLTGPVKTLGIRIPALKLNTDIAKTLGHPYTATSANKSGKPPAYSIEEFFSQLSDKELDLIDLVIDFGILNKNIPSTIIDCSKLMPKIIREGPVARSKIEKVLNIKIV